MEEKNKVTGLALSGGGFRAALFHIGVLAAHAEQDKLKGIDYISCASGGSIVGVLYYLHLKNLLEKKDLSDITKRDYIIIVEEIEKIFLEKMSVNFSITAISNIRDNFKMRNPGYSISDKLADLYYEHFYKEFESEIKKPNLIHNTNSSSTSKNDNPEIFMSDLVIKPKHMEVTPTHQEIKEFNSKHDVKIPILILNATAMNTGRNWQFTATYFGERSDMITEKDTKEYLGFDNNLRFGYYHFDSEKFDLKEKYRKFPLKIAVAASACFPPVFTPMALTELFEEDKELGQLDIPEIKGAKKNIFINKKLIPELIDGGVYDNQALIAPLHYKCTDMIISDAEKNFEYLSHPRKDFVSLLLRVIGSFSDRVRFLGLQITHVKTKPNVIFIRKDIEQKIIIPKLLKNPDQDQKISKTSQLQEKISRIRTNLDAFNEIECYSIMNLGYELTNENQITKAGNWKFEKIKEIKDNPAVFNILDRGSKTLFQKSFLKWILISLPVALLLTIIFLIYSNHVNTKVLLLIFLWFPIAAVFWFLVETSLNKSGIFILKCIRRFVLFSIGGLLAAAFSILYKWLNDKPHLKAGKISNFK